MWGKQKSFESPEIRLRKAEPFQGCLPYSYEPPKKPTAYVVMGLNNCPLSNLIHNAQAHGAQALFIINHEETDVNLIAVPNHLAGVSIHVFLINKSIGEKLLNVVSSDNLGEVWIMLNFIELLKGTNNVTIEVTFSPEDRTASKFFEDLYSSPFTVDIANKFFVVKR